MKHHNQSIGWREANRRHIPAWKDMFALATCYAIVIGGVAFVVRVFCQPI